jgi:hypothetical protein
MRRSIKIEKLRAEAEMRKGERVALATLVLVISPGRQCEQQSKADHFDRSTARTEAASERQK